MEGRGKEWWVLVTQAIPALQERKLQCLGDSQIEVGRTCLFWKSVALKEGGTVIDLAITCL